MSPTQSRNPGKHDVQGGEGRERARGGGDRSQAPVLESSRSFCVLGVTFLSGAVREAQGKGRGLRASVSTYNRLQKHRPHLLFLRVPLSPTSAGHRGCAASRTGQTGGRASPCVTQAHSSSPACPAAALDMHIASEALSSGQAVLPQPSL